MQYTYDAPLQYDNHQDNWYRVRGRRRKPTSLKEEYSWKNPLMPLLYILRIMGRLPYYEDNKDSSLKFSLFSIPVLWAAIFNCVQILLVACIYYWKATQGEFWSSFDHSLMSINELIAINSSFHGLEATWAATPAIIRAINRWQAYQRRLYNVTRRSVSTKLLDHSYVGLLVIIIPSLQLLALRIFMGQLVSLFLVTKEVVYCVCLYYYYLIFWLWIILCSLVIKVSEVLKESLIESISTFPTPEMLSLYRDLWLELHGCVKDTADALAKTLISWKLLLFLPLVFGSYGIILSLKNDNYILLVTYIFIVSNLHIIFFITFSYGYFAQQAVSDNILSAISSRRWVHLSTGSFTKLEILMDSIQMGKPCFEMRGLFTFDRSTHVTMLKLLLIYLVVVVQLKVQSTT